MANSANLEQNHSVHFPYYKFDYSITQNIVQEKYSENPQIATLQKVARASVVGLVLVALFETLKNGAKLLANAALFLANAGYDLQASLANRQIENASPQIQMTETPKDIPDFWSLDTTVFDETFSEPTEVKREGLDDSLSEPLKFPEVVEDASSIVEETVPNAILKVKEERAATTIQRAWRNHKVRKAQNELRENAATTIQKHVRGHLVRKSDEVQQLRRSNQNNLINTLDLNIPQIDVAKMVQEQPKKPATNFRIWNWFSKSA